VELSNDFNIQENNQEWNKDLYKSYVKKEVVENLKTMIQERDMTIINLRKINDQQEQILRKREILQSQQKTNEQKD
jgi:predicted AAA+ superfamily ATPase